MLKEEERVSPIKAMVVGKDTRVKARKMLRDDETERRRVQWRQKQAIRLLRGYIATWERQSFSRALLQWVRRSTGSPEFQLRLQQRQSATAIQGGTTSLLLLYLDT